MLRYLPLFLCFALSCVSSYGQTVSGVDGESVEHQIQVVVPQVSLVKVTGGTQLNLQLKPPTEAGMSVSAVADSSRWLNYSFVKGVTTRPENHVYARIAQGLVPKGVLFTVEAKPYSGTGGGSFGVPVGKVFLSSNEQRVVQSIGSSYTGTGTGSGHQLVYRLEVADQAYGELDFGATQSLNILYTISD